MGRAARPRGAEARIPIRRLPHGPERLALARHREMFDHYADGLLLLLDEEGRVVEANQRALAAYGYTREELVGLPIGELHPPETLADAGDLLRAARAGPAVFETTLRRRDGTTFPVEASTRVVEIAGKQYTQKQHRDISERKRAEEATAYQAMLLAQMNEAVLGLDEKFLLRSWNRAAERIYGYGAEEVLGQPILRVLQTEYHRGYDTALLSRLQEDGRMRLEMRQVRKDGTPIQIEGVSVALRDASGRITGYVAVNRDVTDRRQAEEALRVSEERLKLALEATGDGLWDLDLVTGRGYLSLRWASALGLPGSEVPDGKAVMRRFFPLERHSPARKMIRDHLAGKVPWYEYEMRLVLPSGEARWVLARGKVVERGPGGKPRRMTGTLSDITDRKKIQLQMLQSDRMASMGMLAAGVAHEINNPLAYVAANLGYVLTELAQSGVTPAGPGAPTGEETSRTLPGELLAEMRRALEEAKEGAERVRAIVRDLKTFSRADEPERGPVDVRSALESAINLARNEIRHRARMVTELSPVPPVHASEHRLGQVFLNLLVNAAQAIPEGHAQENQIVAATRTDAEGRVVVEVRDTGSGIAPEALPHIFEPFFTTKPLGVGTGLGLSICHSIVTELGGEIQVESQAGQGSLLRVVLPASREKASETPAPGPAEWAGRGRILVVDDEPLVGRAVRRILSRNHQVAVESSARGALARIERGERFDLVFCDLMMPEVSGAELHEAVRRSAPDQAEGFVFLTGGAFTPASREFLARTPLPRVEKPFDPGALKEMVDRLLRERRSR
jgi:PAS domain S-box-containing protein